MKSLCLVFFLIYIPGFVYGQSTIYPNGVTGCIARWDFASNGIINSLPDVSGNNNNGTVNNLTTASGFRNVTDAAMTFDGSSSYAEIANNTQLCPQQMTLISLVKINGFYSGTCQDNLIISKGNDQTVGHYALNYMDNFYDNANCSTFEPDHEQFTGFFASMNAFIAYSSYSTPYLDTNSWYFLASSYDGNTVKNYQVVMDTNNHVSGISPVYTATNINVPIGSNNLDLYIGKEPSAGFPYWFNGKIDESVIFNRVLSDSEVQAVYDYLWGGVYINSPATDTTLCQANTFQVQYATTQPTPFHTGNTFTVLMSDNMGNFANAVVIGSVSATSSGTITCTIPNGTLPGNGYRIELTASSPTYTFSSPIHLAINTAINSTVGSNSPVCIGSALNLIASNSVPGADYSWTGPNGFSSPIQNPVLPNIVQADAGNYIVTTTVNLCTVKDTVAVIVSPPPVKPIASNNGPLCANGLLQLTGYSATAGVSYQWTGPNNFSSTTQSPFIVNVPQMDSGYYIVTAIKNGCGSADTTHVVIYPSPMNVTAGSNTPVCAGDTLKLMASSSTSGVIYSWSGPGAYVSGSQNNVIEHSTINNSGTYYVSISTGNCSVTDTIQVNVKPLPATPSVSTNSPVCSGNTLNLYANSSTSGVTYQWAGPNTYTAATANATISNAALSATGQYVVKTSLNGCSISDTTSVIIKQTPAVPSVNYNSPVCSGDTLILNADCTTSGVTYSWSGPAGFTANTASTKIINAQTSVSGTYTVTVTLNGCSNSNNTSVSVQPQQPAVSVNVQVNPGDTICANASATFTANAVNAGASPVYTWRKNTVAIPSASTGPTYIAPGLTDGDNISCYITSSQTCQDINTALSNSIHINVLSLLPPTVNVSVYPPVYSPGVLETFTATVSTQASNFTLQWKKNGMPVPGATSSTYSSSTLSEGDVISVLIRSIIPCTIPDSVESNPVSLDVNAVQAAHDDINMYPNPNNGNFVIRNGMLPNGEMSLQIFNSLGQEVYHKPAVFVQGVVTIHIDAMPGIYMVLLTNAAGVRAEKELIISR